MAKLTVHSTPVVLPPPPPVKTFVLELDEEEATLIRSFVGQLGGGGKWRTISSRIWGAMKEHFPSERVFERTPMLRDDAI